MQDIGSCSVSSTRSEFFLCHKLSPLSTPTPHNWVKTPPVSFTPVKTGLWDSHVFLVFQNGAWKMCRFVYWNQIFSSAFSAQKKIIKKKLGKKRLEINPNYAKCWSAHAVSSRTWAVFLCEEPGTQVLAVVSYLVLWLKWLPYFQGVVILYQQQLPQVTLVYNKAQLLLQPATSKQIRLQQAFKKGMCT